MPIAFLTLVKFVLLAVLYLFLARAVRAVVLDVYGPRRGTTAAPPRPAVAPGTGARSSRKVPRELVVHGASGRPRVVKLVDRALTLGRDGAADIVIDDVYVSDQHAQIQPSPDEEGWLVRDLGSTNGTFLNGAKVTQPTPITTGDQLRLGKTRVEVRR